MHFRAISFDQLPTPADRARILAAAEKAAKGKVVVRCDKAYYEQLNYAQENRERAQRRRDAARQRKRNLDAKTQARSVWSDPVAVAVAS